MTERVERLTAALADHDLIEPRFANGRECRRERASGRTGSRPVRSLPSFHLPTRHTVD